MPIGVDGWRETRFDCQGWFVRCRFSAVLRDRPVRFSRLIPANAEGAIANSAGGLCASETLSLVARRHSIR